MGSGRVDVEDYLKFQLVAYGHSTSLSTNFISHHLASSQ